MANSKIRHFEKEIYYYKYKFVELCLQKKSLAIDNALNRTKLSFVLRCITAQTVMLKWESGAYNLCNTGAAPATVSGKLCRHKATGSYPGKAACNDDDPRARRPAFGQACNTSGGVHR